MLVGYLDLNLNVVISREKNTEFILHLTAGAESSERSK
jgi:hypothetical protein